MVVSTEWEIEDFTQTDKLKEAKALHNAAMLRLIKKLKTDGHDGFMIGASGCTLCKPCKCTVGEPCAFPDTMVFVYVGILHLCQKACRGCGYELRLQE